MAKRDTVNVNCDNVLALIRANEWSNAAFSRKVGKYSSWFGEVLRGNNLPSPQEAAQMCVLLQTTPDEILLHQGETEEQTAKCQKDIALVRDLLDQQDAKKAPTEISEREFVPSYEDWEKQAENWTIDQLDNAIWKLFQIKRKREGKHGD
nr:MAG TPA: helix-turn-helix protein [Caudoviricetes sp.]